MANASERRGVHDLAGDALTRRMPSTGGEVEFKSSSSSNSSNSTHARGEGGAMASPARPESPPPEAVAAATDREPQSWQAALLEQLRSLALPSEVLHLERQLQEHDQQQMREQQGQHEQQQPPHQHQLPEGHSSISPPTAVSESRETTISEAQAVEAVDIAAAAAAAEAVEIATAAAAAVAIAAAATDRATRFDERQRRVDDRTAASRGSAAATMSVTESDGNPPILAEEGSRTPPPVEAPGSRQPHHLSGRKRQRDDVRADASDVSGDDSHAADACCPLDHVVDSAESDEVRDAGEVADASSDVDAAAAASTDTSADTASEGGSRNIGETLSTEGNQREVRDHRLDGRNSAAEESRADAQSVGTIPGAPSGGEESRSSPGKKRVRFDPEIKGGVWVQRHSNTGVGGVANGSGSHNRQRMVQLPIQLVRKQIQHQIELQGELTRLKAAVQQQRREQQRINTTLVSCIKVLEQRNAELSDGLPASGHGSGSPR